MAQRVAFWFHVDRECRALEGRRHCRWAGYKRGSSDAWPDEVQRSGDEYR